MEKHRGKLRGAVRPPESGGPGGFTLALSGGASACAEEKAKSLASAAPAMFASGETG